MQMDHNARAQTMQRQRSIQLARSSDRHHFLHESVSFSRARPQISHQYSPLAQPGGKEIGIAREERVANQNIDGLWLFALIVILTGGKPAAEAGER